MGKKRGYRKKDINEGKSENNSNVKEKREKREKRVTDGRKDTCKKIKKKKINERRNIIGDTQRRRKM